MENINGKEVIIMTPKEYWRQIGGKRGIKFGDPNLPEGVHDYINDKYIIVKKED